MRFVSVSDQGPVPFNARAMLAWVLVIAMCSIASTDTRASEAAATHLGVASCATSFCHGSARPLTATRVLQNEYVTWSRFDPHSRSFATLTSPQSQQIATRLGLGKAQEARVCLDCHTHNVAPVARGPGFHLEDGVGCEACHGAASRWIARHHQWPEVTHAANVLLGLHRIDEPAVRAATCVGCHVGDADRYASHRMMAAGHPRLSFELDTYTELWRVSGGREHFRRDADYRAGGKNDSIGVSTWLTGLIETSSARLTIIESHGKSKGLLPEFGIYNCYSCHRAMRIEGWAGADSDGLAPGSVRFDDSSLRLLGAALDSISTPLARELRVAQQRWQAAAEDAAAIPAAQTALRAVLDRARIRAAGWRSSPAAARRMLDAVVASASRGEYPDYGAAEQAAMGMQILLAEQGAVRSQRPDVEALFKALEDGSRFDPKRFREISERLGRPTAAR